MICFKLDSIYQVPIGKKKDPNSTILKLRFQSKTIGTDVTLACYKNIAL
jgi:hypothetical protein